MEQLFYFIVWAAMIFLMMRFGCGSHIMGRRRGPGNTTGQGDGNDGAALRWVPPKTETDPVCGKSVATETAKSSVHDGAVYYFCSRECREVFEAAPDIYLGAGPDHSGLERGNA